MLDLVTAFTFIAVPEPMGMLTESNTPRFAFGEDWLFTFSSSITILQLLLIFRRYLLFILCYLVLTNQYYYIKPNTDN